MAADAGPFKGFQMDKPPRTTIISPVPFDPFVPVPRDPQHHYEVDQLRAHAAAAPPEPELHTEAYHPSRYSNQMLPLEPAMHNPGFVMLPGLKSDRPWHMRVERSNFINDYEIIQTFEATTNIYSLDHWTYHMPIMDSFLPWRFEPIVRIHETK